MMTAIAPLVVEVALIFGVKVVSNRLLSGTMGVVTPVDWAVIDNGPCRCSYCGTRSRINYGNCDSCGAPL